MGNTMQIAKNCERNRQIVLNGLNSRAIKKVAAQMDAEMEAFEADMIRTCNEHCEIAALDRKLDENTQAAQEIKTKRMANIAARAEAKAKRNRRRQIWKNTAAGGLFFSLYASGVLSLMFWTILPYWAASLLIAAGSFVLAVYASRLRCVSNGGKKK